MSRRGRPAFSGGDSAMWLPIVAAGQEMDRRIRSRGMQTKQRPQDVITDEEYPFGHGGVFEIPFTGGDDGSQG